MVRMLEMALFVLLGRFASSSDGCGRLIALLKNSSSVQGGDISHTHSGLSSDPIVSPVCFCSVTWWTRLPAGRCVPSTFVVSFMFPMWAFHVSASSQHVVDMQNFGFRSGMAPGCRWRRDCFPTVARSCAASALCCYFCLRRVGG